MKLFLCGDVMTGRGIDQILPNSVDPVLYESYVKNAEAYVDLAESANGPIEKPVSYEYVWGDALAVWQKMNANIKIINLETSITTHPEPWPRKGINYRMHPRNIKIIEEANIDCCSLANNHSLDWQEDGLLETINTLTSANIQFAGAGATEKQAEKPAILNSAAGSRVLVFAFGATSSGIPSQWRATQKQPGINLLPPLSKENVLRIRDQVHRYKRKNDVVILSVHWGGNWGYHIPKDQQNFAHMLIDEADIDVVHGHSSHHPKGIEVYKNKLIIYGAGDFINDYEGISGHEEFRDDLTLMYFPEVDSESGRLIKMALVPMQIRKMQLQYPSPPDLAWILNTLNREGKQFSTHFNSNQDGSIDMKW